MPYDSFLKKFRRISVNFFAVDDEDKYQKKQLSLSEDFNPFDD